MKDIGIKNIIIGIFAVAAIIAFLIFSGAIKLSEDTSVARGSVEIWGTVPSSVMLPQIDSLRNQDLRISYEEKDESTYESELINAFAAGSGPDLFLMPHENILRHKDKIFEVPYANFPKAQYESTYINQSKLFLTDTGILAVPMVVDPIIMYYNKSLINSSFILDVPQYWDEMIDFAPQITDASGSGDVAISAVAMGTFDNIENAKEIITALILQNDNPMVGINPINDTYQSVLALDEGLTNKTVQAIDFYTSFADFSSNTYSWNEALIDSKNKFIAGELAIYFGKASEVEEIRKKNPNLDFGIELFPQIRDTTIKRTHGSMIGIAMSKQTQNPIGAATVSALIAGPEVAGKIADAMLMAPAHKSLLRVKPDDTFGTLVYNSAIISDGWIDPERNQTESLLRTLVRNVNASALTTNEAVRRTHTALNDVLENSINQTLNN
ncbi:hypothetical protein CL684_00910 [Candidatus Campbellbacteria bacterium]|nr:hypothetical protein [Candidatus Campbellbacteria bacterium]